jgi:hypothetical protein
MGVIPVILQHTPWRVWGRRTPAAAETVPQ